jgi:PAS domain S-box-containing protein
MRESLVTSHHPLSADVEAARLAALQDYAILDSLPERGYDDVVELAAFICGTPISLISLVDKDRQWFKASIGLSAAETPRSQSFCAHTIATSQMLIVEDAQTDPRFKDNPLVTGNPNIRFYAGAPLIEPNGHVLGTVCVIDTEPRVLTPKQISALQALARQVMSLLDQRNTIAILQQAKEISLSAQRLVLENERRLQVFVNSLPTLAWTADANGSITWYNARWYEYTGTTPAEMEGWGWQTVHDPEVLPTVIDRWTRSIQTGETFEMLFPLRGADGILRTFLTRVLPIHDDRGTIVQWFGTNTEVDELHRTRLQLEQSEAGLNQVMHATSDAVVSINRAWELTYLNPAAERIYGPAAKLVGRNLWDAFPDMAYEGSHFLENYTRAMKDGIAGSFEAEYGDPLNLVVGIEVYPTTDGIVTFTRDITKLKHATAAVLQSEKLAAVGRLASTIAHEINNPLASVTNLLYLARNTSDAAEQDEYLATAERELRRVSAITNQTLRFYRQSSKPTPVSSAGLFSETLQLYQGRLINSNIQVEQRLRAANPIVCLEGEIRQVLSNLMGNAIDAMHQKGGRLLLRSREATQWKTGHKGIALTVADTGMGMQPVTQKRAFEAFFSTKGIGGTGLGLWVSKEIMDRHRGTFSLRSSEAANAHGTVFVLFLPHDMTAV